MKVSSSGDLRAIYREPNERAALKVLDHLDVHCRNSTETPSNSPPLIPSCILPVPVNHKPLESIDPLGSTR